MTKLPPSHIEFKNFKFLITDMPSNNNISAYIKTLQEYSVTTLVRFSSTSYVSTQLKEAGISIYDLVYEDGSCPSKDLIKLWMNLLKRHFVDNHSSTCLGVHCSAGLGRAPVMIALALIELGLKYEDAVELIREKRRGAINLTQLRFLEKYRRKSRLCKKSHKLCGIM